jgi:hypothetical protein
MFDEPVNGLDPARPSPSEQDISQRGANAEFRRGGGRGSGQRVCGQEQRIFPGAAERVRQMQRDRSLARACPADQRQVPVKASEQRFDRAGQPDNGLRRTDPSPAATTPSCLAQVPSSTERACGHRQRSAPRRHRPRVRSARPQR